MVVLDCKVCEVKEVLEKYMEVREVLEEGRE